MYWSQEYLIYDKKSTQVWNVYYRGDDYSGASVSTSGPTALATHTLNAASRFNNVTAAGRHILSTGPGLTVAWLFRLHAV